MKNSAAPLALIAIVFMLGIIIGFFWPFDIVWLVMLFIVCFVFAIFSFFFPVMGRVFLYATILLAAAIYTWSTRLPAHDDVNFEAHWFYHETLTWRGVIVSEVRMNTTSSIKRTHFTLRALAWQTPSGWQKISGNVLVNIFRDVDVKPGDEILISGKLHKPFDFESTTNFSYPEYLALTQQVHWILSVKKDAPIEVIAHHRHFFTEAALQCKKVLLNNLIADLTVNEAALMNAFMLGDRQGILPAINDLFVQTGTAHILAISGFNVGIIVGIVLIVLRSLMFLGRRGQYALTIVLLWAYAYMTGMSASVVRATVMASVMLVGWILERESKAFNTLGCAALILCVFNPAIVFDIGFQMSFICVAALIWVSQTPWAGTVDTTELALLIAGRIRQSMWISFVVWLAVAGVIVYYFGIITPITVLANVYVIPVSSLLVVLGLAKMFLSFWPMMSLSIGICIKLVLNLLVAGIFVLAKIPGAYFYLKHVSFDGIILYYTVLILLCFGIVIVRRKFIQKKGTIH